MSMTPNNLHRGARHALISPTGSGRRMSRRESAEAVNEKFCEQTGRDANLNSVYIGWLGRGRHRWPIRMYRDAVFKLKLARELGFWIVNGERPTVSQPFQPVASAGYDVMFSRRRHPMVCLVLELNSRDAS